MSESILTDPIDFLLPLYFDLELVSGGDSWEDSIKPGGEGNYTSITPADLPTPFKDSMQFNKRLV